MDWLSPASKFILWATKRDVQNFALDRARSDSEEGFPHNFDYLTPVMNEAIQLLAAGPPPFFPSPRAWLRYKASNPAAALRTPHARAWLSRSDVQESARYSIRERRAGSRSIEAEEKLHSLWSEQTGERPEEGRHAVHSLLAFIALSVNGYLKPSERILLESQKDFISRIPKILEEEIRENIKNEIHNVGWSAAIKGESWIDKEAHRQLAEVLRRRSLLGHDFLADISAIVSAIEVGELRGASAASRATILAWQARGYAGKEQPIHARKAIEAALALRAAVDLTNAEARVLFSEGQVQDAYKLLRDRADPESLSLLFWFVFQSDGPSAAFKWLNDNNVDPPDLSIHGLQTSFLVFAELGQWDRIKDLASTINPEALEESPAVLAILALNMVALTVPEEQRLPLIKGSYFEPSLIRFREDEASNEARSKAAAFLGRAASEARVLGVAEAAERLEYLARWIELINPPTRLDARNGIARDVQKPEVAVRLAKLIVGYNIPFDKESVLAYLEGRRKLGGWSLADVEAAFVFLLRDGEPEEVRDAIAKNRSDFERVFTSSFLVGLEIRALEKSGKIEAARELLRTSKGQLEDDISLRLSAHLGTSTVEGRVVALREIYERTNSLNDLYSLIEALTEIGSWDTILPYAKQSFSKTGDERDARLVVDALRQTRDEDGLFAFLSSVPEMVERSLFLKRSYAWCLFREGRLPEADRLLAAIPDDRRNGDDRNLYVAISVESGDWERLGQFVESEWDSRRSRSSTDMIRTAGIAMEIGSGRVLQLLSAAVDAAPNDPAILVGAYGKAVEAGYDDDQTHFAWLERAIKLSGPKGPIQAVSLKELIDMQPGWQRQVELVSDFITKGNAPLFVAAQGLQTTLTRLLLMSLSRNSAQVDPRRRSYIPAFHAASLLRGMGEAKSIALDLTTIFVLHHLAILDVVVSAFDHVTLPANTLAQILTERQKVRFHQPSRLKEAEALTKEVQRGRLKICTNFAPKDLALEVEVGGDLALLVATAARDGGAVIRPAPIHRVRSLGEERANLKEAQKHVFDTHELVNALRKKGKIGEEEQQRALTYLQRHDEGWGEEMRGISDGPLYLDGLTINYLWATKLLAVVCAGWDDVYISAETYEQFTELDAAVAEAQQAIDSIDTLRRLLQRHIALGNVVIAKRRDLTVVTDEDRSFPTMTMLAQVPDVDVVAADDRYINQHPVLTDVRQRSVPVVTSLGILDFLKARHALSDADWRHARHRLRMAAVGLVPLEVSELKHYLDSAESLGGLLIESQELRAIRENLAVVAMAQPIDIKSEGAFIAMSLQAIRQAIMHIWNQSGPLEEIRARASWVFDLMPRPLDFVRADLIEVADQTLVTIYATHFAFLSLPAGVVPPGQMGQYASWINECLKRSIQDMSSRLGLQIEIVVTQLIEELVNV